MASWQVATGLSIATLVPMAFLLFDELEYLSGYWGWLWAHYWYPLGLFGTTGETPSDALNAYRQSFRNVLLDLADESESSMAFKEAVKEMFFDVNIVREQEWRSAVDKVREGKVTLENIRRVDADTESYIQVEFKDLAHVSPADNYPSELEPPALAA